MSEAGWPTRTDWDAKAQQKWAQRWGEDKELTERATKQRAELEREKRRVPDEPTPDESQRELKIARSRLRRFWRNVFNAGRRSAPLSSSLITLPEVLDRSACKPVFDNGARCDIERPRSRQRAFRD
jgi:hypothetical protein